MGRGVAWCDAGSVMMMMDGGEGGLHSGGHPVVCFLEAANGAQQSEIQERFVAGTLSAEKRWKGVSKSFRTCLTTVDFPIWRAPMTT